MVFSTRLKYYLFFVPAHWPVNTPAKLCSLKGSDISSFAVAAFTLISDSIFAVVVCNFSCIFLALTAENCNWPVNIFRLHFMSIVAVFIETFLDNITVLHSLAHSFCIAVCTITACLIQELWLNTNTWKLSFNINLVMAGIIFVAAGCIRYFCNRIAKIFFKDFRVRHVSRNFTEYIVIVP